MHNPNGSERRPAPRSFRSSLREGRFALSTVFTCLAALVMTLWGCQATPEAQSDSAVLPVVKAEPDLRLYIFDCGSIVAHDLASFSVKETEISTRQMFVPCYLIDHPKGRLLWDAGLPPAVAKSEEGMELSGMTLTLKRPLDAQMADIGMAISSVNQIAFSHLHFDHAGHANLFANATHLIQRSEFDAAFAKEPIAVFDPSHYGALKDSETVFLKGDHDVFGDGRVKILSAPGHTPGHQVLYLELEETGKLILSGDLYHFPVSRSDRRIPVFNTDPEETLASMDKIEGVIRETGATLWIEHDWELSLGLKKAPLYYQ